MHELTIEELKEAIINRIDPDQLIELLGIGMEDLVEALSDFIELKYVKILHAIEDSA